jgi:plasmid maintenance system antidote protein VapI
MTPTQYQDTIDRLGLSQVGAARLFGVDPRTSRRWVAGDLVIPRAVALALRLMVAHGTAPDDAEKLAR